MEDPVHQAGIEADKHLHQLICRPFQCITWCSPDQFVSPHSVEIFINRCICLMCSTLDPFSLLQIQNQRSIRGCQRFCMRDQNLDSAFIYSLYTYLVAFRYVPCSLWIRRANFPGLDDEHCNLTGRCHRQCN